MMSMPLRLICAYAQQKPKKIHYETKNAEKATAWAEVMVGLRLTY